jgi:hypothetical protein
LGLPCASSVTEPEASISELLAVRTPGRNTWPLRFVPAEPLLGREAASWRPPLERPARALAAN